MKHYYNLFLVGFVIMTPLVGTLEGEEATNDTGTAAKVRDLWKLAIVEDQRDYDGMTKELRKITSNSNDSNEALTAQFLIGRIELDRAQNEAIGSFLKAKAVLEPLATKHPKTWQGQMAQIVSLHILQLENHHREVIIGAQKALIEIDWDLFGKNAPADLSELLMLMEDKSQLTPDVMRVLIVNSYLELKEAKAAGQWIEKIQDEKIRQEIQNQLIAE